MAGSRLPRQLFLQGVAAVFLFAFASLYTQIPGLYGPEGILPARRTLRPQGKGRWKQLWETPTLLWEAPLLGLDTAQGLELLSLLGALLALGALLLHQLRHPLVYLLLWASYLSAYQVGQVFLYFQCPHLPLRDSVPAHACLLVCPPAARLAAQAQRGGHLCHRDRSAPSVLRSHSPPAPGCLLLPAWPKVLLAVLSLLLELAVYGLLAYGTGRCFGLEVDWKQRTVHSKTSECQPGAQRAEAGPSLLTPPPSTAFTFHQFSQWLKTVTLPTMWLGAASLAWELLTALWRWTHVRGWLQKFCAAVQLSIFGTATVALFTVSLVPYSYMEPSTHGRLWTGAHRLFGTVEHLQLANSYGLFRRMTGLGGRPEVVLEGSYDGHHWTEIEFMYKPGNVSRAPPIVAPHQPRLDWQMWFAALGPHTHSPWFTSLVLRLLQGKEPVIRLIQNHAPSYPFHQQPPTYVRAQRYKYWFSPPGEQGQWWRRQWVEEFFPPVSLGDPTLDALLRQFGLQDKSPPRARSSSNALTQALHWVRKQLSPLEAPVLLWGLLGTVGAIRVTQALLGPRSSPRAKEEKHRPAPREHVVAASKPASPAPSTSSGSQTPRRKKQPPPAGPTS
ncbi:lipase maturation factor 2 isoform X4 [Hippopotamus amphibius kiboko]|uniref:lipase maturation factor 2 isoform X4 n=1 Tax=Hippopotamus amphibius kiboko TaxID=575201 RepID=UPI002597AC87|nr:lipase maturation factor 2 isoform X4 [Hippopotamus amphibius kiboko]